uniref:Bis(5'-nucleosyl)-tetraphosphatase [asymmetrical] n=1 Tax=Meloidogyne hapla TaxID=6305 RepID=A0A1I8BIU4_MELHA
MQILLNIYFCKLRSFLIIGRHQKAFFSTFGHVDPGENEWQAAIREVKEESGIDANEQLTIIKDFKHEMFYYVKSELKRVTYWLAKANDSNIQVTLSHEHLEFRWVNYEDALDLVTREEMKEMLEKADDYINKNSGGFCRVEKRKQRFHFYKTIFS